MVLVFFILYIFRVQFQYGGSWASSHPDNVNTTDNVTEILLESGEVPTGIEYKSGNVIDALQFVTNFRIYPKVGGTGGTRDSVSGVEIKFFVGDMYKNGFISQMRAVFMECWETTNLDPYWKNVLSWWIFVVVITVFF